MADSETLRAALREAETAILDVAKLIDPAAPGDRQAAEDIETVGMSSRNGERCLTLEIGRGGRLIHIQRLERRVRRAHRGDPDYSPVDRLAAVVAGAVDAMNCRLLAD